MPDLTKLRVREVPGGFKLYWNDGSPAFGYAKVQPFASRAEALSTAFATFSKV